MEYFVSAVLFAIVSALILVHFLIHNSGMGILVNKIPGPSHYPIFGNTIALSTSSNLWEYLARCAKRFQSGYKLWISFQPVVFVTHPDDAEILLNNQKNLEKSVFYRFLRPWLKEGLLSSSVSKWRTRRKMIMPAFHVNILHQFVDTFIEISEQMVNDLRSINGEIIEDVNVFVGIYTLNAICATTMGTTLKNDDPLQKRYRACVSGFTKLFYKRAVRPWLYNHWIFSLTPDGRKQKEVINMLHEFTMKIIRNRQKYHESTGGKFLNASSPESETNDQETSSDSDIKHKKKRRVLLDHLIAIQREHRDMQDTDIQEEVDTFIFGGSDTIATGMAFVVLLLAEHKEIQTRAREEIDAAFLETNGKFGISDVKNLQYLDCCIKEAMRLYPPIPGLSRNIKHDLQLKNYLVAPGTVVHLSINEVHRNPNSWPNPHIYDPDRFLPENVANRHPYAYVPFSGGMRNCPGQKFALLELKILVAYLLHNFHIEPVTRMSELRFDLHIFLHTIETIKAKFIPINC